MNEFCKNCGRKGHLYQKCNHPIISLGIIAVRYQPQLQFLMICRRNTLGYVDFIRGKYELDNIEYIQSLFDIMTVSEINDLVSLDFLILWNNLWQNNKHQYENEYINANYKYTQLLKGLIIEKQQYTIQQFIDNIKIQWTEPEWGFPKGRRNYLEGDYKCAIREWSEETGYNFSDIDIIKNITPYNEIFVGTNNKVYKYKYYVGLMDNKPLPSQFQKMEISKVAWFTPEECKSHIREYNYEKINILEKMTYIFNHYTIYG
tara:strand:+ start:949 stop:1728 length:780 start_codon:yes stop_codon:yes gene_type:complete